MVAWLLSRAREAPVEWGWLRRQDVLCTPSELEEQERTDELDVYFLCDLACEAICAGARD